MDFSTLKLNCSRLGAVMSDPKGALTDKMFQRLEFLKAKEERTQLQEVERIELQFRMDNYNPAALSQGCITYLMFLYQYLKYGPQYKINTKSRIAQLIKGNRVEKSSLELIKKATGQHLYRYKSNLSNDYLKGRLDVIDARAIADAKKVIDIKNPFSQFDFMKIVSTKEIPRRDNFQMQGYFALTGKDHGELYYCLSDFTEDVIAEQKAEMMKLLCPEGVVTEEFLEEWQMAENSMRFGHIPDEERIIFFPVERDDKIIAKIYEKVEFCREWLAEFESKHLKRIANQIAEWQARKLS